MQHNYYAKYNNVTLRPLGGNDIELLRNWRNDKSQTSFLRNIGEISQDMQKAWYEDYLNDNSQIIFAIEENTELHRMVGSVALYNINRENKTAEIGKIQIGDPAAHGKGIGRKALVMAMRIGFLYLSLAKIVGSVHQKNVQAHTNDMKVGFQIVGTTPSVVGGIEDLIEINERQASSANPYYYFIDTYDASHQNSEFYIGKTGKFTKTITEADIVNFAGITGDFNPVHINDVAARDSLFGRRIAHGMLTAAFISTVIGTRMPGENTVYLKQNSTFVKPVFINDTITSIVSIKEIHKNNRALLSTTVVNQDGSVVVAGTAEVILPTL